MTFIKFQLQFPFQTENYPRLWAALNPANLLIALRLCVCVTLPVSTLPWSTVTPSPPPPPHPHYFSISSHTDYAISQFHFLPSPAKERLSCLCLCLFARPRPGPGPRADLAWGQPGVINVIFDFITQKHFVIPKWSDDDELNYTTINKKNSEKNLKKYLANQSKKL